MPSFTVNVKVMVKDQHVFDFPVIIPDKPEVYFNEEQRVDKVAYICSLQLGERGVKMNKQAILPLIQVCINLCMLFFVKNFFKHIELSIYFN